MVVAVPLLKLIADKDTATPTFPPKAIAPLPLAMVNDCAPELVPSIDEPKITLLLVVVKVVPAPKVTAPPYV